MTNHPASEGFFMPAEWAPHGRCWMAWPSRESLWGEHMDEACEAYADVAKAIADFEPVSMVCNPADAAEVSIAIGNTRGIDVLPLPIDDSWMRDFGPTFLVDGKGGLAAADWRFNSWGEKFLPFDQDAAVAHRILEHLGVRRFEAPFVLEGGAIHVDGEGTLITTEQCLLNPNRNPSMSREDVEQALARWVGAKKVIWLPRGLEDDETDGHVDNVACFVRPGVVMAVTADDPADGNHEILTTNLDILRGSTDAAGRPIEVIELPFPAGRQEHNGLRLALSYVNFYIANGGIVMPAFGVSEDDKAFRIVRDAFPDRKVVQVHAREIVVGGGGIHCITQQQPQPRP